MPDLVVAVFGAGKAKPGDEAFGLAYETGKALGQAGYTIINGGYGGTMLASAQGAVEAGAKVIGVACAAFKRSQLNEFVTEVVTTVNLDERLDTLIGKADAYVVLPGGTGTLLELAKVWELKNKHFLPLQKPIILVGGFWQPLVAMMASQDADSLGSIIVAATAQDVVEILKNSL